MWVLVVGGDVLDILDRHNMERSRRFFRLAELDPELLAEIGVTLALDLESLDELDEARALPNLFDRLRVVEATLVAEGEAREGEMQKWVYRVVYASESSEGIHAPLIAVLGHLIQDPERWSIKLDRYESGDGAGKILWATTLLVMLARRVFKEFWIGTDGLDEMASPIQQLANDLNENPPWRGGPTLPD
jgi:hypothetical protein